MKKLPVLIGLVVAVALGLPSSANAGSTKLRERPLAAMRGRQAASPRPKVSRSTGHNRAAAPWSAGALRTATARGSQKRR